MAIQIVAVTFLFDVTVPVQAQDTSRMPFSAPSLSISSEIETIFPLPYNSNTEDVEPTSCNSNINETTCSSNRSLLYQTQLGMSGSFTEQPCGLYINGLARAYYMNDQRLEWSGQEATFGAEGIIAGGYLTQHSCWKTGVAGELYVNQPFDRNILIDTPERVSYRGNFEYETLELSQLYIHARKNNWLFALGKMPSPFGRTYFPMYQNNRSDAPFLRTESVYWRETGAFIQYDPGLLTLSAAVINGSPDRDTNSSKAGIARIGVDSKDSALGTSVKWQDGIGSEGQKTFNRHVGIDAMFRCGAFTFSSEAIYDEYGFRRPGFDPNDITWRRSIYHRDQNLANKVPITGMGYYLDGQYEGRKWLTSINYGEFYPKQIGDPIHDILTRRAIFRFVRHLTKNSDFYNSVAIENDVTIAQAGRIRGGTSYLVGFQFVR